MRRALHLCAFFGFVLGASPLAAQQSITTQLPSVDQTSRSVPPAPPPERRAQTPPPFPAFPYVEPRRRHVQATRHSTRLAHAKVAKQAPVKSSKRHERSEPQRKLSKQEKKDQRYCASLSERKRHRNSKCGKLAEAQRKEAAAPPRLTKQDKKDERFCGKLSLREVLRNSKCRKVAQRQLAAERDESHKVSHRTKHASAAAKHKANERQTKAKNAKERSTSKRHRR